MISSKPYPTHARITCGAFLKITSKFGLKYTKSQLIFRINSSKIHMEAPVPELANNLNQGLD